MNCFSRVIAQHGASDTHQGENGWLFSVLQFGNLTYSTSAPFGADQSTNPVTEAIRRLRVVGISADSLLRVQQTLNKLEVAFNAGHQY